MSALELYLLTLLSFACINAIGVMGLNMQFGNAGILNLAYVVLVAVGAYATGIATLGPPLAFSSQHYIGGFAWAFPWNLLFGVGALMVVALGLAAICFTRISHWYLAVTLTAIGYALLTIFTNDNTFFNGVVGLVGIPGPWQDQLDLGQSQVVFFLIALACAVVVFAVFWRVERSPFGRTMRAIRDNELASRALGKNPLWYKTIAFLLGSAAAGLCGGLTALYLGAWSPAAWLPGETFLMLAAVVVGGRGWTVGAVIGSLAIYDVVIETSRFMPQLGGRPDLVPALQSLFIGGLLLAVMWWRPYGLLREPKQRFPKLPTPGSNARTDGPASGSQAAGSARSGT